MSWIGMGCEMLCRVLVLADTTDADIVRLASSSSAPMRASQARGCQDAGSQWAAGQQASLFPGSTPFPPPSMTHHGAINRRLNGTAAILSPLPAPTEPRVPRATPSRAM